jgi:hypothetical protein
MAHKKKIKQDELVKQLDEIIESEFEHALYTSRPKLKGFKIYKATNINNASCYHDIDPILYNSLQNPMFDVPLRNIFKYQDTINNKVIDAFKWGQCIGYDNAPGCGSIYYFPTSDFVQYILGLLGYFSEK